MVDLHPTQNLNTVDILNGYEGGQFRFVAKTKLGMSIVDPQEFQHERFFKNPEGMLNYFKKGVLQTIQFQPQGSPYWLTVFSRTGKNVKLIDLKILENLKVGTINSCWYNTNLYSQTQYRHVGSQSWDSYAYRQNTQSEPAV